LPVKWKCVARFRARPLRSVVAELFIGNDIVVGGTGGTTVPEYTRSTGHAPALSTRARREAASRAREQGARPAGCHMLYCSVIYGTTADTSLELALSTPLELTEVTT
jgi:hypothetical protein